MQYGVLVVLPAMPIYKSISDDLWTKIRYRQSLYSVNPVLGSYSFLQQLCCVRGICWMNGHGGIFDCIAVNNQVCDAEMYEHLQILNSSLLVREG